VIDYLFSFPDEATAHTALDPLGFGLSGAWDASRVLPVQLTVGQQQTGTDPLTSLPIMVDVHASGFWLVVSVPAPRDDLYAIPYCMREADRDKALAGKPYVNRERFTAVQLAVPWSITPQWCGVNYANAGATV
jgi:hypothetical protein